MDTQQRDGLCIGGPLNGERLAGAFDCDKVKLPFNPHIPTEQERASWGDSCPDILFDQIEYRWAEGAWHYGVH